MNKPMVWAGRVSSALVVTFLVFDGLTGLLTPAKLAPALAETGFAASAVAPISIVALVCALVYAVPRTAVLGAILVTGFLGGAINTHFRVSNGIVAPEVISLVVGVLAWLGLWLRDAPVRALLPISS